LLKLAEHPERAKLIDLARGVIHVQPEISKTRQYRQTKIRPALHQWLTRFEGDIWPTNADRMVKHIRAHFDLAHDVLRHPKISAPGAPKSSSAHLWGVASDVEAAAGATQPPRFAPVVPVGSGLGSPMMFIARFASYACPKFDAGRIT